jgi:histidinol dehydrogenase
MVQSSSRSNEKPGVEAVKLAQRLHQHPHLRTKVEELLAVVENTEGDLTSADAAEQRVIEEIRKLGQAALQGWAEQQNQQQTQALREKSPELHRSRQKNSTGTQGSARLQ